MDNQSRLKVKIFSPYETFFEGTAISLSAQNKTGPFDVLYGHTNFFTLLLRGRVSVDTGFNSVLIEIDSGLLRVHDNVATLFANV
jgi:F0F1-type ATP synthase epsilon subunit